MPFRLVQATEADREYVRTLRERRLRSHVEAHLHWDDAYQSKRFMREYVPEFLKLVVVDDKPVGCVAMAREQGYPTLRSFYIDEKFSNAGLGSAVLAAVLAETDAESTPTRLTLIRGSGSERLYVRFGYRKVGCDRYEDFYVRYPTVVSVAAELAA
jgi:RimJ/RimL family protein N-acetyltransferase